MSCHSVRSCRAPELSFHVVVVATENRASDVPCGVVRISGSLPRFPIRMTLLTLAMCSSSFQVKQRYSRKEQTDDVRHTSPSLGRDPESGSRLGEAASTAPPGRSLRDRRCEFSRWERSTQRLRTPRPERTELQDKTSIRL